jgi:hypothetical protein
MQRPGLTAKLTVNCPHDEAIERTASDGFHAR